ncbi:MAG: knotted carbamoyltransferase YgeW [Eggerthellaceae bacterium]|jgi:knotted carbamoyltransferase YgeW|nr:knotted carbamoyltransferase YgeW [Eggerthellaceae bacterium]
MTDISSRIKTLGSLNTTSCYQNDVLLTWDKSMDELMAITTVADILRCARTSNIAARLFESGLGISLFRDNSTRTRFSFASACNLLGLEVQDLNEHHSQIAHGETVRETVNMISFMADVIGIRDDKYIGRGHTYMLEVAHALDDGYRDGTLEQRPSLINLQCDIDHPTQAMADLNHLIHHFGGVEHLKGKRLAMSWAYSPSYGKPLSVPQGIVGLMSRFGMDVVLAHPDGYEIMPEVEALAQHNAQISGGSFTRVNSIEEAFEGADIVYPKSWAPFNAMKQRSDFYKKNDTSAIDELEQTLLSQNAEYMDWSCTEQLMHTTHKGSALYMHCLPADISGVNCARGEVDATVFDRYRKALYQEAQHKPYIIAAMIALARTPDPALILHRLINNPVHRQQIP